jgi:hypothetical protein
MYFAIAMAVLIAQSYKMGIVPVIVPAAVASPYGTWVIHVYSFVHHLLALVIKIPALYLASIARQLSGKDTIQHTMSGTKHLGRLYDHLNYMLVALQLGGYYRIVIKHEYVHSVCPVSIMYSIIISRYQHLVNNNP